MMKKLAALLLGLLVLGTLATAQTADYTGTWYLVSVEIEGITLNPADLGIDQTIVLNADGTGLISTADEEDEPAAWTLDGETLTITAGESPLDFTANDDGQLVADAEGYIMTFGREPASSSFVAAAQIAAADISDFDGIWTITTVDANGMIVPFAAMAQIGYEDAGIVIQNGSVTSLGVEFAQTGTLTDGKLVVASVTDTGTDETKTFALLEDGTIAMTYMDMVFYCERVIAVQ